MPNTDEFYELAKRRRNIRGFEKKDVPDEYIQKILEIARWEPSAGNFSLGSLLLSGTQRCVKKSLNYS